MKKTKRDITKAYAKKDFIRKIRRLADSLEKNARFSIQIAGERIVVPQDAVVTIEHERGKEEEEIEFQIVWKRK